jgi:hypothetical protein
MFSTWGIAALSKFAAYGIGTSTPVNLSTGASKASKAALNNYHFNKLK